MTLNPLLFRYSRIYWLWVWPILAYGLTGCSVYSFTGTNISPDVKTISVKNFTDRSGAGPAFLSQQFSEGLRDYYQRNTSLSLVQQNGDLQIEGGITGFALSPVAATGNQVAAQTRLTITIQVKYVNLKDDTQNFDRPFTFFADFDQSQSFSQVQNSLIERINNQLILDIFNATVANW